MEDNYKQARNKLIVALDTSDKKKLRELVSKLDDRVDIFKVGLEQYLASRGKVLDFLRKKEKKIFLDLKFHDIPNTMAAAARRAVAENVWMFNIHVTGREGMLQVKESAIDEANRLGLKVPLIIGVTVLTSLSNMDLEQLGIGSSAEDIVTKRAKFARDAGLNGVVSSAQEAGVIKSTCGEKFVTVCPGIRPDWAQKGDQKRIMTPAAALKNGADYLVIGRPITKADNPAQAAKKIMDEMEEVIC